MSMDKSEHAKRVMIGRPADWIKRFDPGDYKDNPPMIEKLYEERQLALTVSFDLEKQVRELEAQVVELKLLNQRLNLELKEASRKSIIVFGLSLLATVLVGIGVNIATSSPYGWTGWVMIISALILEGIAFLARPKREN